MFGFRIIFILHALFFLTNTQHNPLKLNLLRDGNSIYCVISHEEESTAVGFFNDTTPLKSFKHRINFLKLTNTNFFCDISTNETCKDVLDNSGAWKYDKSDNYNLPLITDRRWEDFNIIESGRINFVNVYNITKVNESLKIDIKVKIDKDAHIYLCDGIDPLNSDCYWFVIGGWATKNNNQSKSIVRTCKKTELEKLYVEDVFGNRNESCSKHPDEEKEPQTKNHTIFLSSSYWTSLLLEESKKAYIIIYNSKQLIETKIIDNYEINVKHIFVASPSNVPGKWGVRNKEFITGEFQKLHDKLNSSLYFSIIQPRNPNDDKQNYYTSIRLCNQDCKKDTKDISLHKDPILHWKHFKLQSTTSHFLLFEIKNSTMVKKQEVPLNYVHYIAIQSRNIAYWKKHVYGIFVAQKSNVSSIPFAKGIKGQRICVAIFAYCAQCSLSFQIIDSDKNVLATTTYLKIRSWEQVILKTILGKDVQMDLKIILDKVDSANPAFIGDITECTGNLRIIKTINEKSNISCTAINHPSISPTNTKIVLTSSFENTSDALWLSKNKSCKEIVSKQELEKALNCSIITSNYEEFVEGEEICFLSDIRRNLSASNPICEILGLNKINNAEMRRSHLLLWLVGPITITLCFFLALIYFKVKKNSTASHSSWAYFSRAYTMLGGVINSNRTDNTLLEMSEDSNSVFSWVINVKDFGSYVETGSVNIINQFLTIDSLNPLQHTIGSMKDHIRKNRYKNIIAYDSTRVVLDSLYNNVHDNYINANYITGYQGKPLYIATQGPMATTVHDFWRMIWQENVPCVVMLTKLLEDDKIKCHKYWPDDQKTFDCCAFKITCTKSNIIQEDLTIRHLKVTFNNVERALTQIHYEGWLDYKTANSLDNVRKVLHLMNEFEEHGRRIVVHCSAGVGRTGSLILCDTALKMAKATSKLDLYSILYDLRQERMNMVQNVTQYEFSHKVIAYILENKYDDIE